MKFCKSKSGGSWYLLRNADDLETFKKRSLVATDVVPKYPCAARLIQRDWGADWDVDFHPFEQLEATRKHLEEQLNFYSMVVDYLKEDV